MVNNDKNKTLVLFDVGSVQVELDYGKFYDVAARYEGIGKEQFKAKFIRRGIEQQATLGNLDRTDFLDEFRSLVGGNLSNDVLLKIYSNAWPNQIKGVVDIKKELHKAGYEVGLFSNLSEFALMVLTKKFPDIFETYDGRKIFSYECKSDKSSNEMYEKVPKDKKIVYIDDNINYVRKGVEEFGWDGILFTPYIDSEEIIRSSQVFQKPESQIIKADSIEELVKALKHFGLEF